MMATQGFMYRTALVGAAVAALLVGATSVGAQAEPAAGGPSSAASGDRGASYWTPARRAAAQPRDLVVDERGLGYLQRADGTLEPYGHAVGAAIPVRATAPAGSERPQAGPPSGGDGVGPAITGIDPADGSEIGAKHGFRATVKDNDGIKSVDFVLSNGFTSMSYSAARIGTTDVYGINFTNFTDGDWSWSITARDNAKRGGAESTAGPFAFKVDTGGGSTSTTQPPPTTQPTSAGSCDNGTALVVNEPWTCDGQVQTAAGRLYFEMPANRRANRWNGYVCSGTVVDDGGEATSVILTAAHCVYDDVNKAFARNVLFIPDQAGTTGAGTDQDCSNDPLGCWEPSHGVVDVDWTTRTFPDNIPYDYAYYVVPDAGARKGAGIDGSLDAIARALPVSFSGVTRGDRAHALGYSYSDDPDFMFCAEGLGFETSYGDHWLANCGLSGGSSGGPWIQPMDESTGIGTIISVNSWGYTNSPGMGGPPLDTTAKCVFDARTNPLNDPRGVIATCP